MFVNFQSDNIFRFFGKKRWSFHGHIFVLKVKKIFIYLYLMTYQKCISTKLTLLGLIAAFLYSALVLPVANTVLEKAYENNLTLLHSTGHSAPNTPIPLQGEEKEEENRSEKDSKFIASFLVSPIEFSLDLRIVYSKNRWVNFCPTPLSSTPLYLLKNSFQI